MSNDLTTPNNAGDRVERLQSTINLAAGQYWRAKAEIPELRSTHKREKFSFKVTHTGEMEEYTVRERRRVPPEQVLLVKSLKVVDGDIHAIDLAAHPMDPDQSDLRFLVDEFFGFFEPAPDADLVRQRELGEINSAITGLQNEIVEGPPDLPAIGLAGAEAPDVTALVKMASHAEEIGQRVENSLVVAQQRATWISERTKLIGKQVEVLSRFHQERAVAALASVETTIRQVEKIKKGLRSLKLYTGEGVEVETVARGAAAPSDEPLTIYQRRLFLDEELLVHVGRGGIEYDDLRDLPRFIGEHPEFIERVAPMPRSVVLMNVRRHANLPAEVKSIAEAMDAMAKARLDTAAFLLVRNGENIHLVWSDHVWSFDGRRDDIDQYGLVRLFPSSVDLNAPFRGARGEDITPDSLTYSDARARFDDRGLAYRRLLILLWGLNDRESLFGTFYDRSKFDGWVAEGFQEQHFRFVADEALGLVESRMPIHDFIRSKNAYIQPGSRVLCLWRGLIDEDHAPGAFRWMERANKYEQTFNPTESFGIEVVRTQAGKLIVQAPVRRSYPEASKRVQVTLADAEGLRNSNFGMLCLDTVTAAEIDRYIESRRDREHYQSYLWMFMKARDILAAEEAAQAPVVGELQQAIVEAKVAEPAAAERAVAEAVRLWRAASKGVMFPARKDNPAAFRSVLNACFLLLGKDVDLRELGQRVAAATGRVPLRVSVNADGRPVLYATVLPDEERAQLGRQFWAYRAVIDRSKPFPHLVGPGFERLTDVIATENAVVDYPDAAAWKFDRPPAGISYDELNEVMEAINVGAKQARILLEGIGDIEFFNDAKQRVDDARSNGMVNRVENRYPVGLVWYGKKPVIVVLEEDPMFTFARHSAVTKQLVSNWFGSRYKNPGSHRELLEQAIDGRRIGHSLISMEQWRAWFRTQPNAYHGRPLRGLYPESNSTSPNWRQMVLAADRRYRDVKDDSGQYQREYEDFANVAIWTPEEAQALLDEVDEMKAARSVTPQP